MSIVVIGGMSSPLKSQIDAYAGMSSGEQRIARALDAYGIPYAYEHPTLVMDQGKQRIWYPDFSLQPYGTLVEYFGVTNNSDYERGIRRRLDTYAANHLDVIDMYPSSFSPGWDERLLSRVERVLESRLYRWRDQVQQKQQAEAYPHESCRVYQLPRPRSSYRGGRRY